MDDPRPFAFLVSTTPHARSIRDRLGSPAYSYAFVLEALRPALERLGTCTLVDRPESRVHALARRAEAEGFRPVHLAIVPPQDAYFAPGLPNVVVPFWEFPDIPDRDFGHDTRQNWARACLRADLILAACTFTAGAFERARLGVPVAVVPVPVPAARWDVPDFDPGWSWTLSCRHEVLGGPPPVIEAQPAGAEEPAEWGVRRRVARQVAARLSPELVGTLCRAKRRLAGRSAPEVAYILARAGYNRTLRRTLSPRAVARVTAAKNRVLGIDVTQAGPIDPVLPATPLTLSGLVFTTFANVGDRRKNLSDLLSAFLIAFRDRGDATLVLKLASSPSTEHRELSVLRGLHRNLGIEHRCRVVALTEFLDDDAMAGLLQATAFYVNASHAEGACLPLQQALAAGRPAIAPDHTAMADYLDDEVAFVVGSAPEPTHWPHDPEERIETERARLRWSDLHAGYLRAAEVFDRDPDRYEAMAAAARRRMAERASVGASTPALAEALRLLGGRGRLSA